MIGFRFNTTVRVRINAAVRYFSLGLLSITQTSKVTDLVFSSVHADEVVKKDVVYQFCSTEHHIQSFSALLHSLLKVSRSPLTALSRSLYIVFSSFFISLSLTLLIPLTLPNPLPTLLSIFYPSTLLLTEGLSVWDLESSILK